MKNKKTNKKILLVLLVIFLWTPFTTYAVPSLDDQINQVNLKIKADKSALSEIKNQVYSAQVQLEQVNKQLAATESNIATLNQGIIAKEVEIKAAENQIIKNKETLKELVKLLYEKGQSSTIELLASTESLTDLMNTEEYNRALEDRINTAVTENKTLRAGLINQKQQLADQKNKLEEIRRTQIAQQAVRNALLAEKSAQQASLERHLDLSEQERNSLLAQRRSQSRRVGGGGTGGYPWANGNPYSQDAYGYYQRECVSYVAWYWNEVRGRYWGRVFGSGKNNGNSFDEAGRVLGYNVTSDPQVAGPGAIMVWNGGTYGHVAIVEQVISRYQVQVIHYNYYLDHNFSRDIVSVGSGNAFVY